MPPKCGPSVKFGTTEPISLQEATDADLQLTERMMQYLEAVYPAETTAGMQHRQAVLQEIEDMVVEWMTQARKSAVKITTLGSYRLGVVHPGSDIDALCIGPPHVGREEFFATFARRLNAHEHVSECVPIPDAYTPIIKLKMRGVCVDLLFARLVRPLVDGESPEDIVKADEVLKNMDERSVRCINGFRVADQILQLVPNRETFRWTLRFVKYWARRRGIYSNVLGFFGGITWSLLVARVCQLYPYYAPSQLVTRFFRLFAQWNWSKPVMLCHIVDRQAEPGMHSFKVWNPKTNPADRQHIMPVITPAFPAMNSTHNVTETTKRIMLAELKRGYEVVRNIEVQKAEWSNVHEPFPFFQKFRNFLWIESLAKTKEVHNKYSGWVESKLRILIMQLEMVNGMIIHPNPVQYDTGGGRGDWPYGCAMFLGMAFPEEAGARPGLSMDIRPAIIQYLNVIDAWPDKEQFHGLYRLKLRRIRRSDLPDYVQSTEMAGKEELNAGAAPPPEPAAKRRRRGDVAEAAANLEAGTKVDVDAEAA